MERSDALLDDVVSGLRRSVRIVPGDLIRVRTVARLGLLALHHQRRALALCESADLAFGRQRLSVVYLSCRLSRYSKHSRSDADHIIHISYVQSRRYVFACGVFDDEPVSCRSYARRGLCISAFRDILRSCCGCRFLDGVSLRQAFDLDLGAMLFSVVDVASAACRYGDLISVFADAQRSEILFDLVVRDLRRSLFIAPVDLICIDFGSDLRPRSRYLERGLFAFRKTCDLASGSERIAVIRLVRRLSRDLDLRLAYLQRSRLGADLAEELRHVFAVRREYLVSSYDAFRSSCVRDGSAERSFAGESFRKSCHADRIVLSSVISRKRLSVICLRSARRLYRYLIDISRYDEFSRSLGNGIVAFLDFLPVYFDGVLFFADIRYRSCALDRDLLTFRKTFCRTVRSRQRLAGVECCCGCAADRYRSRRYRQSSVHRSDVIEARSPVFAIGVADDVSVIDLVRRAARVCNRARCRCFECEALRQSCRRDSVLRLESLAVIDLLRARRRQYYVRIALSHSQSSRNFSQLVVVLVRPEPVDSERIVAVSDLFLLSCDFDLYLLFSDEALDISLVVSEALSVIYLRSAARRYDQRSLRYDQLSAYRTYASEEVRDILAVSICDAVALDRALARAGLRAASRKLDRIVHSFRQAFAACLAFRLERLSVIDLLRIRGRQDDAGRIPRHAQSSDRFAYCVVRLLGCRILCFPVDLVRVRALSDYGLRSGYRKRRALSGYEAFDASFRPEGLAVVLLRSALSLNLEHGRDYPVSRLDLSAVAALAGYRDSYSADIDGIRVRKRVVASLGQLSSDSLVRHDRRHVLDPAAVYRILRRLDRESAAAVLIRHIRRDDSQQAFFSRDDVVALLSSVVQYVFESIYVASYQHVRRSELVARSVSRCEAVAAYRDARGCDVLAVERSLGRSAGHGDVSGQYIKRTVLDAHVELIRHIVSCPVLNDSSAFRLDAADGLGNMHAARGRFDSADLVADAVPYEFHLLEAADRMLGAVIPELAAVRLERDPVLAFSVFYSELSVLRGDIVVRCQRAFVQSICKAILALALQRLDSSNCIYRAFARCESVAAGLDLFSPEGASVVFLLGRRTCQSQLSRSDLQRARLYAYGELLCHVFAFAVRDDGRSRYSDFVFARIRSAAFRRETGYFVFISVHCECAGLESLYALRGSVVGLLT